jgi:CubicO group peptidase (beta-lactamase class C family)
MDRTGWHIRDIDTKLHAVPYTRIGEDFESPEEYPDPHSYLPRSAEQVKASEGDLFPHCLYSFPNYSDGLVRSSVTELSRFLLAMINGGKLGDRRILEEKTIDIMLSDRHFGRALCWSSTTLGGKSEGIWYHGGSDPGVMTFLGFRPHDKVASARQGGRYCSFELRRSGSRISGDRADPLPGRRLTRLTTSEG